MSDIVTRRTAALGLGAIGDTLDPAKGGISTDYARHNLLYSGLTELDTHLRPQLALAEAIETSDRTIWQIRLRSGVEFHDGSTLTAQEQGQNGLGDRHAMPAETANLAECT